MSRTKAKLPTDELRERFAINLRECRQRLGISQEELTYRPRPPRR